MPNWITQGLWLLTLVISIVGFSGCASSRVNETPVIYADLFNESRCNKHERIDIYRSGQIQYYAYHRAIDANSTLKEEVIENGHYLLSQGDLAKLINLINYYPRERLTILECNGCTENQFGYLTSLDQNLIDQVLQFLTDTSEMRRHQASGTPILCDTDSYKWPSTINVRER